MIKIETIRFSEVESQTAEIWPVWEGRRRCFVHDFPSPKAETGDFGTI